MSTTAWHAAVARHFVEFTSLRDRGVTIRPLRTDYPYYVSFRATVHWCLADETHRFT